MGLNNWNRSLSKNRDDFCKQAKKLSPRLQSASKNSNTYSQLKDGLRVREASLDIRRTWKAAAGFPVLEIKDVDLKKKLNASEGLRKKTDCLLSSDSKSSPLELDRSQNLRELDGSEISLHDQFSSMSLSGSSNGVSLFDGSRVGPIEEASLVLDSLHCNTGRKPFQEKVHTWLHNIDGIQVTDSSHGCLEIGDSSCPSSLFEDSSVFDSSCTSLTTYDRSPSFASEFDRTDIWASLVNLEGDDSELIDTKEHGFDSLGSDFPSPSFSDRRKFLIEPPDSGSVTYVHKQEANSSTEGCEANEPLFWPYDSNSYGSPELDNFLCMSPRKNVMNPGIKHVNKLTANKSRFSGKSSAPIACKSMPKCRKALFSSPVASKNMSSCRKALFSSTTEMPTLDCRNNNDVKKNTRSSRLSKSTQNIEQHLHSTLINKRSPLQKAIRTVNRDKRDWMSNHLLEPQASPVRILVLENRIEKMIGLKEFDGHEGIDVEFDTTKFSLDMKTFPSSETELLVGQNTFDNHRGMRRKSKHSVRRHSHPQRD